MDVNKRKPPYRKTIIAALAAVVGLGLSAVIVIVAIGAVQESRDTLETMRQAFQESPEDDRKVIPAGQESRREIRMVDIVASPGIVRLNNAGDSQRLSVRVDYSDGSARRIEDDSETLVSYTTADPSIARVDSDGVVTGITNGGTGVVVRYGDLHTTVPVLISGPVRRIPAIDQDQLMNMDSGGPAIVLNRVMVRLGPGYGTMDANSVASSIGGKVIFEFRTFPGYVVEFKGPNEEKLEQVLGVLQADRRVVRAYPDMVMPAADDASDSIESLVNSVDANAYLEVGMDRAWKIMNSYSDKLKPVIIAVIDSHFHLPGLDSEAGTGHELIDREFDQSRMLVADLVAGKGPPEHGVGVASVIVAENNPPPVGTGGFSGVVSSVDGLEYYLIFFEVGQKNKEKMEEKAVVTALDIINALEHIEPYRFQVAVVNMSFALRCENPLIRDCGWQYELAEAMRGMGDVTFVVGAGNGNRDIHDHNIIPASFTRDRGSDERRRALDNVITVAGTRSGRKHSESNYGPGITLAAPYKVWGVKFGTTGKYSSEDFKFSVEYSDLHGTSYSAPLVTGTVAMLKALDPGLTPTEIKNTLTDTGTLISVCNSKGSPCPEGDQAKWRELDAGAAVKKIIKDSGIGMVLPIAPAPSHATPTPAPVPTTTPSPTPQSVGTPTPTPYRLRDTELFLLKQTLLLSQSPQLPYAPNSMPFSEWPDPIEVVGRDANTIFWWFILDRTRAPEDLRMEGFVRLVDVTFRDHPVVMLEDEWRLGGEVGVPRERVEVPRSAVVPPEIDTGHDVRYEIQSYGFSHQDEQESWPPGIYQVQLLDDRREVLFYWEFEVR